TAKREADCSRDAAPPAGWTGRPPAAGGAEDCPCWPQMAELLSPGLRVGAARMIGGRASQGGGRMLNGEQLAHWEKNGYLILPGFFQPSQVAAIDAAEAHAWATRHPEVVVDDLFNHQRKRLCRVSAAD